MNNLEKVQNKKQKIPQVLVNKRGIIIVGNEILLIKRQKDDKWKPNHWEFPGGKMEKEDHPDHILEKEIKEEIGVTMRVDADIAYVKTQYSNNKNYEGIPVIMMYFLIKIDEKPVITLSKEHQAYEWVNYKKIDTYDLEPIAVTAIKRLVEVNP